MMACFVSWIGGLSGRYRDRSRRYSNTALHNGEKEAMLLKLVDLAADAIQPAVSLPRLLIRMHTETSGKLLSLALIQVHQVYAGALMPLTVEQRFGMYFAGCGNKCCFVKIIAVARLAVAVDATYRGPIHPKFLA